MEDLAGCRVIWCVCSRGWEHLLDDLVAERGDLRVQRLDGLLLLLLEAGEPLPLPLLEAGSAGEPLPLLVASTRSDTRWSGVETPNHHQRAHLR